MLLFMKKYKNAIIYLITILFAVAFIFIGNKVATKYLHIQSAPGAGTTITAKVTKILSTKSQDYELGGNTPVKSEVIVFDAKITSGSQKGKIVQASQTQDGMNALNQVNVTVNSNILMSQAQGQDELANGAWIFTDNQRSDNLMLFGVIFFILLLLFGRKKGFNTIVSLVFTCLAIFIVFIPALLSGYNIYITTIIVGVFIILMTLIIINGINKKSLSSAIGCLGGLAISGVLTIFMSNILKLTGGLNEDSVFLMNMNAKHPIDLKAVIFAAIIIGALGAVIDVSISISSSLNEICEKAEGLSFKSIVNSGSNIGRDIIGAMSNTLILAYIGSSLAVVLLLVAYNNSMIVLFNKEMIVVDILQALIGSFGILLTIPITSIVFAYLHTKNKKPHRTGDVSIS